MSALTSHAPITEAIGGPRLRPAAAVLIYDGSIIGINSSGYARGFTLGDRFGGHALEACDNASGSAGDRTVKVRDGRYQLKVSLSGVAITDAFKRAPVYAQDSGTLSLRAGLKVGHVVQYVSSGIAIVEFDTNTDVQILAETMSYSGFTDNTNTTGYKDFATAIPAGALVLGWEAKVVTGFTGDTTAVAQVGVSGNVDRFTQVTTGSVLAAGTIGSGAAAVSGDPNYCDSDTTARVTVTGGADFTSISAGEMDVSIQYLLARAE